MKYLLESEPLYILCCHISSTYMILSSHHREVVAGLASVHSSLPKVVVICKPRCWKCPSEMHPCQCLTVSHLCAAVFSI